MRTFFKKITNDPYTDWLMFLCLGLIGIVCAALGSFVIYTNINTPTLIIGTATSTKATVVDIKKLETIIQVFEKKNEIYENPKLPTVDVRDPSL